MGRFQTFAAFFFALSLSIWLGRADLHTDDTGILVGLIGCGALLVALVEPKRPWIWGLLVPAGVILVELWNNTGWGVLLIAAVTVTIAAAASYLGAFLRRLASNPVE
jgi:hypothetical protein